jgi:nucleoside-diphosphate-sugar epimerase
MRRLFCIGLGYTACAYVEAYGAKFDRISGTVRTAARKPALAGTGVTDTFIFDGAPSDAFTAAIRESDCVLVSAPPAQIAMAALAAARDRPPLPVVYLSSLSVYGDHGGAEIDESAALDPTPGRGRERVAAEEAWTAFGAATGSPVAILRLAGIYGPGRNALATVAGGRARSIVKSGQVFNRIHVADIAQMIDAAFAIKASGVFNGCDDQPAPPQDVIAYAARLLGQPPPPEIPFDVAKAGMSEMAQSFYAECKRALNGKIKTELGVTLRYPNYRAGLDALFAGGDY